MTGVNIALLTVLVTYGIVCQTAERTDTFKTSSKAVARIADRTASQHLCARGHVRSSGTWLLVSLYAIFYWWSFGTKPLSLTVSEIFNVECNTMVGMTLIRPLDKGQDHSFWYQSISYIQAVNSNFCCRTHRLAKIHSVVLTDRQTQHC